MKTLKTTAILISLAISGSSMAADYWADYQSSRASGSDLRDPASAIAEDNILPNFSYAGYQFGNQAIPDSSTLGYKIFKVTAYGAIANDGLSDKQAIRDTIAEAENHIDNGGSGAIIEFPAGQFRINDSSDMLGIDLSDTPEGRTNRKSYTMKISRGNIIIRGAGPDTVLFMEQNLELIYPSKDWTTPYILQIGFDSKNPDPNIIATATQSILSPSGDKFITTVASDHLRESTQTISVADSSKLQVGQWVQLTRLDDRLATIEESVYPYQLESGWTALANGLRSQEFHQITKIQGNDVTFAAPIHHSVNADGYWGLKHAPMLENIGIENLTFKGNWHENFVHHQSGVHDGGWSAINLSKVSNSWIDNVTFTDVNVGLTATNSAATTIEDITFNGNPGHLSLDINSSTHILARNIQDPARHWHAAGFSHRAVGNVLTNSWHAPDRYHNLHADQPYANLIDKNEGGWNYGLMGGSISQQPNHLKYLVFWNNRNTAAVGAIRNWSFMRHDSNYGRVIMPYVVGLTGWTFDSIETQQKYDASLPSIPQAHIQAATQIDSLYDAQLQQRRCATVIIDPNLIGEWPLAGSTQDLSCNPHNPNPHNAVSFTSVTGTFNGIDERVELGDFDTMTQLEFDVRYNNWNTAKASFVVSKSDYGTNNPYYVQISQTGTLSARVNGKGISAGNLGDGNWHHIIMTLNANTLGLNVDGVDRGTQRSR